MKILAYEVRDDERAELLRVADELGVELSCTDDVPSMDTADAAAGFDAATFLGMGTIDERLLTRWHELGVRFLSTRTVGHNHIELSAAHRLGMRVCNAGYPPEGVAEFTVMLMLLTLRNYKPALWRQQVNDYSLSGLMGRELSSLTVGIVGLGRIGQAVARCLSGFGCTILACNPSPVAAFEGQVEFCDLDDIFLRSDLITLHVPLTDETHHMIDAAAIERMKPGVVLINCARGGLADTDALIAGIESGHIGALGMDVIEGEEGITHIDHKTEILSNPKMAYLRQFPNVVLTQHMAFYTLADTRSMAREGIRGIVDMAAGRPCPREL
ncbi:D-isomer specific 2-hydroxyacid dehydrogenase family protein [Collinsella sp. An2]|uniref:D-isomer specific 2-hydroxyacid dehydrogenase family protein n=1 Tax=Collinsella sp. An2 TaxID=1965585 RepID=UPI000B3A30FC|nr:D-isomer specific 2-hydroxyacid dehydrogenase family protein [Collinsella sp. An2]OUP06270.1 lactate dehydrogenase [Collinsella sp. An2]